MAFSTMSASEVTAIRESLGLTQAELARRVGTSQAAVCMWEKGIRRPGGPAGVLLQQLREEAAAKKNQRRPKKST